MRRRDLQAPSEQCELSPIEDTDGIRHRLGQQVMRPLRSEDVIDGSWRSKEDLLLRHEGFRWQTLCKRRSDELLSGSLPDERFVVQCGRECDDIVVEERKTAFDGMRHFL